MLLFQQETANRSNLAAAYLYENVFLKSNLDLKSFTNCICQRDIRLLFALSSISVYIYI